MLFQRNCLKNLQSKGIPQQLKNYVVEVGIFAANKKKTCLKKYKNLYKKKWILPRHPRNKDKA